MTDVKIFRASYNAQLDEVTALLQPGQKVRFDYGEPSPNNRVCHIRAIIDEEYIAFRVWSKTRRRWLYYIDDVYFFQGAYALGYLKRVK
jgi:hypothetical protein